MAKVLRYYTCLTQLKDLSFLSLCGWALMIQLTDSIGWVLLIRDNASKSMLW